MADESLRPLGDWGLGTTCLDSTAIPDVPYSYWLQAGATGEGARSSGFTGPLIGMRTQPPTPSPSDVRSSDGFAQSVLVEWTGQDANYYRLYRTPLAALKTNVDMNILQSLSDPVSVWQPDDEFVDIPPSNNEPFVYSVAAALDSAGFAESELSLADTGACSSLDQTAPVVEISLDPAEPIGGQPVLIELLAQDAGELQVVELHLRHIEDSSITWHVEGASEFSVTYEPGAFAAGDTLEAWATGEDSTGNVGRSERIFIIVSDWSVSRPSQPAGRKFVDPDEVIQLTTGYSFCNLASSEVDYRFDLGDSLITDWGDSVTVHSWSIDSLYFVRAQARSVVDTTQLSPWSDALAIWVDSKAPEVIIISNGGSDFAWAMDSVYIMGEAHDSGSGVDSVFVSNGTSNLGVATNWGFSTALPPSGQLEFIVQAIDLSGNVGADTIEISVPDRSYTVAGMAYHHAETPDSCHVWDQDEQQWRVGIPDKLVYLGFGTGAESVAWGTSTDSCGNYSFSLPSGDYEVGIAGEFQRIDVYRLDTTLFDSLLNIGSTNAAGFDMFVDSDGLPTNTPDHACDVIHRQYTLDQNYPNPFNPLTNIRFDLPRASWVSLDILNVLGQRVNRLLDQKMSAGQHNIAWDGTNDREAPVASGVYFYRLKAGDHTEIKKMLLLR